MSRVRLGAAAVVFAASLAFPCMASAGIMDFIWEMSGPSMVGAIVSCEFNVLADENECRVVGKRVSGKLARRADRRLWLTLQGGVYLSTGKDSEMRDFKFARVQMLAYEPILELRSFSNDAGNLTIHHGVMGLSYFFLMGSDFKNFDNVGFKLVPIVVTYKRFTLGYNVRIFPNGFTSQQFGVDPSQPTVHVGREVVNGITVGFFY